MPGLIALSPVSDSSGFHLMGKNQIPLTESSELNSKFLIETSKEEMKSVVLQEHEFCSQQKSISQTNLSFVVHQICNDEK